MFRLVNLNMPICRLKVGEFTAAFDMAVFALLAKQTNGFARNGLDAGTNVR